MDTGEGRFKQFDSVSDLLRDIAPKDDVPWESMDGVFSVGEKLTVKGSRFKVAKITPKKLILRLLPKE